MSSEEAMLELFNRLPQRVREVLILPLADPGGALPALILVGSLLAAYIILKVRRREHVPLVATASMLVLGSWFVLVVALFVATSRPPPNWPPPGHSRGAPNVAPP